MPRTIILVFFIVAIVLTLWFGFFIGIVFLKKWGLIDNQPMFNILNTISVIIPLIISVTMFIGNSKWSKLNAIIYTISSSWVVVIAGFFTCTLIVAIVSGLLKLAGINNINNTLMAIIAITGTALFSSYGIINANIIRIKNITIDNNHLTKELSGKKIALISDLHIGMVRGKRFTTKVTAKLLEEKPDIIIIAGDLIDGPIFPYQKYLAPLSKLYAPMGIYYTPGNHEQYNLEQNKFYSFLPKNISLMVDSIIKIPETDIKILGIDYRNEGEKDFMNHSKKIISNTKIDIAILHDPKHRGILGELGSSLVLSGHTHGGQFFPGTLLVKMIYKEKTRGLYTNNNSSYYTTAGVGTAVSPARIGTNSEIVILNIK